MSHRFQTTLLLAILAISAAVAEDSLRYQVEAEFLMNFTKFIHWPPDAFANGDSPVRICILQEDRFGNAIDRIMQGEFAGERRIAIERIRTTPAPKRCQVLFVGEPERTAPRVLHELGRGVLTVGEGAKFIRAGGMIAFVLQDKRVRFQINRRLAEANGLKLSSRLLSVAEVVDW